jgi:hypothetical protein
MIYLSDNQQFALFYNELLHKESPIKNYNKSINSKNL